MVNSNHIMLQVGFLDHLAKNVGILKSSLARNNYCTIKIHTTHLQNELIKKSIFDQIFNLFLYVIHLLITALHVLA